MISVFGWNGSYIVSCCGAMFGTGNFVLVKNLVKNIKIFYLRPFAAICDHFEAPHSQKDVQESEMAYSPFSCLYLGSWTLIPFNFFTPFWLWGTSKWSQMAANGLKWKIFIFFTRFLTKIKFSVPKIALQQLTIKDPIQPKMEIKFKVGFYFNLRDFFGLYLSDLRQRM